MVPTSFSNSSHGCVSIKRHDPPRKWYPCDLHILSEDAERVLIETLQKEISRAERHWYSGSPTLREQITVNILREFLRVLCE